MVGNKYQLDQSKCTIVDLDLEWYIYSPVYSPMYSLSDHSHKDIVVAHMVNDLKHGIHEITHCIECLEKITTPGSFFCGPLCQKIIVNKLDIAQPRLNESTGERELFPIRTNQLLEELLNVDDPADYNTAMRRYTPKMAAIMASQVNITEKQAAIGMEALMRKYHVRIDINEKVVRTERNIKQGDSIIPLTGILVTRTELAQWCIANSTSFPIPSYPVDTQLYPGVKFNMNNSMFLVPSIQNPSTYITESMNPNCELVFNENALISFSNNYTVSSAIPLISGIPSLGIEYKAIKAIKANEILR